MSELVAIFITAFLVGLSGALMPGPLLIVNLHQTGQRGWSAAPLVTLGHGLAELLFLAALLIGFGRWLAQPQAAQLIATLGGSVLLYMSLGMLREAKMASLSPTHTSKASPGWGPITAGLVTSFSNPYWFVWWSTVGATYVALVRPLGWAGLLAFFSGHIFSDLSWFLVVSLTFVSGRRLFSDRVYRYVLTALAGFLALLGGGFLLYALHLGSGGNI